MAIFFMDSLAHLTTNAQLITKISAEASAAPAAGTGAFAAPGIRPANNPNGYRVNFAAKSTIVLSAYVKPDAIDGSPGNAMALFDVPQDIGDGVGGCQCRMKIWSNGQISFYRGQAGGTTLLGSSAAGAIQMNVHSYIRVEIVLSQTVGSVKVRVGSLEVLNLTGLDTSYYAIAQATDIRLFGEAGAGSNAIWSHIAFGDATTDVPGTLQPRVEAVFPDGPGAATDWPTLVGAATNREAVD